MTYFGVFLKIVQNSKILFYTRKNSNICKNRSFSKNEQK